MKKILLFFCLLPFLSFAQSGYIHTIAGNGTSGFSGDGGPATAAQMGEAVGNICADGLGNIYFTDYRNNRIRKVSTMGVISTYAGGGSSGADGIPATAASITINGIASDRYGTIYFIDGSKVRKIDPTTSIVTTIAGTGIAGYSGDGGLATAAMLNSPPGICVDLSGNVYIGDESNSRVRKITPAGYISTYAGVGSFGFSGDGGPATNAQVGPAGLSIDAFGNLYIADRYNHRIRKVSPSGIISTYAGDGVRGFSGDGGAATLARFFEPSYTCVDVFGNVYVADFHNSLVRKITTSGIISTFAGSGSSLSSGVPATSASLSDVWGVGVDRNNNIYVTDRYHYRICRVTGVGDPIATADSFSVCINTLCEGPSFTIIPVRFSSLLNVKTFFGDGSTQIDPFSSFLGAANFNHTYNFPRVYTIKHVLYNGTAAIDSISYNYTYQFCRSMPVRLYYDGNSNCTFDTGTENYINHPTTVEIDSNGVAIDTLVLLSGMDYNANGFPGDIYKFKVLSAAPGLVPFCPSTGIISDTLAPGINTTKYIGFQCSGIPGFDLTVHATSRAGIHQQEGHVIVSNNYCTPQPGFLSVTFSPRYVFGNATPAPTSVVGNTMNWNLGSLSTMDGSTKNINYMLSVPGTFLIPRDTVHSAYTINPISGDENPDDNNCDRIDTVKGSYDPNQLEVSPAGIIPTGALLTYTAEFENTGNDTAQNIFVLDTLPNSLDIHSLAMVASTHSVILSKKWNGANWVLRFDFPNIKLLDSSHHGLCTGVFVFKIRVNAILAPGTVIPNKVGIYFDDNEVIMTNTAFNEIETATLQAYAHSIDQIKLYPNPVTNMLHLEQLPNTATYRIINILGAVVSQGELQKGSNIVPMQSMEQGVYLLEVKDEEGNRIVRKVVKE